MGNKGSSCEHLGVSKITVPIWKYERINSTDESFASLIGDSPHEVLSYTYIVKFSMTTNYI